MLETLDRVTPEVTLVSRSRVLGIDCDSRQSILGLAIWFSKTERPSCAASYRPLATFYLQRGGRSLYSNYLSPVKLPEAFRDSVPAGVLAARQSPRRAAAHRGGNGI